MVIPFIVKITPEDVTEELYEDASQKVAPTKGKECQDNNKDNALPGARQNSV